jgi:SAM-dependent methyltransferase
MSSQHLPPRINLGCGRFPKPGYHNVDWVEGPGVDAVVDLSNLPLPFPSDTFDEVSADHVLEHLPNAFGTMREIHRVLRPGGRAVIRVPHFSRGMTHAEHERGFDVTFPYYFRPDFQGGYTGTEFETESVRLRWFAQPYLKKTVLSPRTFRVASAVGKVIDVAANLDPLVCSRLWCFAVGGFDEVEFVFRKPGSAL